jgi:uridine phosphorylase
MKASDNKFLHEARIEACDELYKSSPLWMEWRDEEIEALRMEVANQMIARRAEVKRTKFWKLLAFSGWFFATLLFLIPVIERLTR